jgi:lipopolysaccharide transport system permease protein
MSPSIVQTSQAPPVPAAPFPLQKPLTVIRPGDQQPLVDFTELWQFRRMVLLMVWRDVKIKFKQSFLGPLWIILTPLCSVLIYTFIFGNLARMPSDQVPYALFSFVGLIPWTLFSNSLGSATTSLVNHSYLIQKVYFPRLLLPVYGVLTCLPDFLLLFGLQLLVLAYLEIFPTFKVLWIGLFTLWILFFVLGASLVLAALNVRFRDVGFGLGFATQLLFYATPVAYPTSALPGPLKLITYLNPMTWICNGYRWALLGTDTPPGRLLLVPLAATLLLLFLGIWYFRSAEKSMADVI